MSAKQQFDDYLEGFASRLKLLATLRGTAIVAVAALVFTGAIVTVAIRQGFPADLMIAARIGLLLLVGGLIWRMVLVPRRRSLKDLSADIESRAQDFDGRVVTWVETDASRSAFADLLAEDSLRVAGDASPEEKIPMRQLGTATAIGGVAMLSLLLLGIAGPGNYAYGVRDLWLGWLTPGSVPPQSIVVVPGDDGIRLGGKLNVRATMHGFSPAAAAVHVRFGDEQWQQVDMAEDDNEFEFTFFSVRQPLEYYVSAASVRSPSYRINVVDLPRIENMTMTYHYPEWAEREPDRFDPGGDVRAIADTRVEIQLESDRAMTPGYLIVNDQAVPLSVENTRATASFDVSEDGQYFVAAAVGGERIRLTDDYFVTLLEDAEPRVEFARPGRDWNASRVEEVTAIVRAADDYRLESVQLHYSVNGGDWQAVPLTIESEEVGESQNRDTEYTAQHEFFLESLSSEDAPLKPGDLVAYYAVATDREREARTDIFFIDVQPFDRRYSQSQQSGSAGGQQGGQQQDEISRRQREIIVSTWNLIREQQQNRRSDPSYVDDNAALLSRLQSTLREQVETLARRTEARQLTASAEEIARFVDNLEKAGRAMQPAAERLAEIDLEEAILPEQEALQHLLAAEAVFTDINVSLQSNNGGGGGGQAGRDLAEMFELEMDLEKNQYETGSRASPSAPADAIDEAADKLAELARRQEQLARNLNSQRQPTTAERWQQEMLRREAEELRDRLEELQQQAQQNQQGGESTQQASNNSGQPQGQSSGPQGEEASGSQSTAGGQQAELEQLRQRLDSAIRAMNDADRAMREGGNPDESQRAADEAGRQLDAAQRAANEEMQRAMQASVEELANRADELYDTQADMEQQLQDSIRGINVGRNDDNRLDSGMTIDEEYAFAAEKRRLQAAIQTLEQEARNTAQQIAERQPAAADEIRDAMDDLRETEIENRLAVAAAYIEQGEAVYVAGSESAVTEALRELSEDMRRASELSGSSANGQAESENGRASQLSAALAETQALRRELRELTQAMRESSAEGSDPGLNDAPTDGSPTSNNAGNRGRDDLQRSTGVEVGDLENGRRFDEQADNISQDVIALFRELRAEGVSVQDIDELRRLAADIRAADFSGNPSLLEAEAQRALSAVEQLEIALSRTAGRDDAPIRVNAADEIPSEHRAIVADYYRRLSELDSGQNATDDESDQ